VPNKVLAWQHSGEKKENTEIALTGCFWNNEIACTLGEDGPEEQC
jgi:hypothetical protein